MRASSGNTKECNEGCYFLEKPIKKSGFRCKRVDCERHVFKGWKMKDENGVECFGKKGHRLVTVMSYAAYTAAYPPSLSNTTTIESSYMEIMVCVHIVYLLGNC